MQPKAQYRIAFQRIGPSGLAFQLLQVDVIQEARHGLNACILTGCFRQGGNAGAKSCMLLGHALRLAFGVHTQHVFQRVPEQVGGHAGGFLDAHGHPKNAGHLLLAMQLAGVAQLQQFTLGTDLQQKGDFLLLQPEHGQALRGIGVVALAAVVVGQGLQNHPRASSNGGTVTVPLSNLALKKRGCGSDGWVKSRSCSIQPSSRVSPIGVAGGVSAVTSRKSAANSRQPRYGWFTHWPLLARRVNISVYFIKGSVQPGASDKSAWMR
jgi:hypothetical protein